MKQLYLPSILTVFLIATLFFNINASATTFTEPSGSPTSYNAYAPLDTSANANAKIGGLLLNSGGATNGLIVQSGNVGIGTTNPTAKLDIAGTLRIVDGSQGSGKVLTSDSNGIASWGAGSSGYVSGGLYGKIYGIEGGTSCWSSGDYVPLAPAYCEGSNVRCPSGFRITLMYPGSGYNIYSCYKL